jgi:hypothetical protein
MIWYEYDHYHIQVRKQAKTTRKHGRPSIIIAPTCLQKYLAVICGSLAPLPCVISNRHTKSFHRCPMRAPPTRRCMSLPLAHVPSHPGVTLRRCARWELYVSERLACAPALVLFHEPYVARRVSHQARRPRLSNQHSCCRTG